MSDDLDRVSLAGITFFTHVGCTPEERKVGQHLELDVDVYADLESAAREDAIDASIDYADVYRAIEKAVAGREANLIEHIAHHAADACRAFGAAKVTVRVRKTAPPFPEGRARVAEVEITRRFTHDA